MPDEIDWDDYDELAADRAWYATTQDPAWLPVIADLERKLGLQPGQAIPPYGQRPKAPSSSTGTTSTTA